MVKLEAVLVVVSLVVASCGGGARDGAGGTSGTICIPGASVSAQVCDGGAGGIGAGGGSGTGGVSGPPCATACSLVEYCSAGQCVNRMTEYMLPLYSGYPADIAAGPDGDLWITISSVSTPSIVRMTLAGDFTTFMVPTLASYPQGIALGPDGRMWFAESQANRIAATTTAGAITEYPLSGNPRLGPLQVVRGPDGNMWFTATSGVGYISLGGAITLVTGPLETTNPDDGIALGPDGNIWATFHNAIYRISRSGEMTTFPVQVNGGDGLPTRITAGPDGNLWFTGNQNTTAYIGSITPGGSVSDFTIPAGGTTSNQYARDIVSGPDGNVWFTESYTGASGGNQTGAIGRITPEGAMTLFPVTGDPTGIAVGPDGNLWFTESYGLKVVRFVP